MSYLFKIGLKWTTLSSLFIVCCSLLSITILTRYVDKSEFGLIAIILFSLSFFDLFNDMGISASILHKQNISQEEYSSLYWFNIFVSIFLYCIIFIISPLISMFYKLPELSSLIQIAGLSILINGVGRQFKVIQDKELRFKNISIVEILSALIALIISSYLAIRGYGVYALIANTLTSVTLSNLLFFFISYKLGHRITFYFSYLKVKPFLKIGLYQMGGQVANYFSRDFDILIIGKIMGPEILGVYSLSKQLVARPYQVLNPIIIKVATPLLATFQSSPEKLRDNYLKFINIIGTLNIIAYSLLFLFAPIIIGILYGDNYVEANMIVRILCVYMIIRSVGNPIGSLTIATGKTYLEFYWNLLMMLLIPLFIFVGSFFGIYAISYALVLSSIIGFYPFWRFLVSKMINVSFWEYFKKCFLIDFKNLIVNERE